MKNYQRIGRGEPGFTLMEIIVVVAIIGILTATAIPGFMVWLPNYKLKSAVQDLFSNMQTAKMEAIRANGNYTMSFSTAGNGSYIMTSPGGSSRTMAVSHSAERSSFCLLLGVGFDCSITTFGT